MEFTQKTVTKYFTNSSISVTKNRVMIITDQESAPAHTEQNQPIDLTGESL